jgi:hypothetical protein
MLGSGGRVNVDAFASSLQSLSVHVSALGLLRSQASVCRISPKTFVNLVAKGEFGMGLLSGAFEERGISS